MPNFSLLANLLKSWAQTRDDIRGVGVVGSYARGAARTDSDIDVVLLTTDPQSYLFNTDWLRHFGKIDSLTREDWGAIQSVRGFYEDGSEIEFGIGAPSWASIDPLDPGTREVVKGGLLILFERGGLLSDLIAAAI